MNTFLDSKGSPTEIPGEVIRATETEKFLQINRLKEFQLRNKVNSEIALSNLEKAAIEGENIFTTLMDSVKHLSLGQITESLYRVGGQYRRNT